MAVLCNSLTLFNKNCLLILAYIVAKLDAYYSNRVKIIFIEK